MVTHWRLKVLALLALAACVAACSPITSPTPTPSAVVAATSTVQTPTEPTSTTVPVGYNVGQRAPDFAATTLNDGTLTLAELRATGDPVMLFFFTTW